MAASLASKVAIITGAGGGLGKAIATAFIAAGARTVLVDINKANLDTTVAELGEKAHAVQANVAAPESVQNIIDETIKRFGTVDVLVNNAGVMDNFAPVGDVDLKIWDKVIAVNLTGPMLLSRAAIKHFLSKDTPGGVIVNIGSTASLRGNCAGAAYTTSKHALVGLTKNTAAAYHKKNIRCNIICPGAMMNTNIKDAFTNGTHAENQQLALLTMAMQPNVSELPDMANVAVYLASDTSKTLNGAVIAADGGWSAF
ncbi:putative short chain dehydrogenase/oxidoreductase [Calocera viscosa TUFC12733]|uniref:Putative short chain dehydrogenase/oxidoreductase n=1 Tax=Calocera viscosa (strain TUFC12733) TaxID=1330018 RepID=A0A167MHM2_CALVF|nr:putative short chain dehydrogenase/oxidoreductase [Calocera viscosa TUFC12733]